MDSILTKKGDLSLQQRVVANAERLNQILHMKPIAFETIRITDGNEALDKELFLKKYESPDGDPIDGNHASIFMENMYGPIQSGLYECLGYMVHMKDEKAVFTKEDFQIVKEFMEFCDIQSLGAWGLSMINRFNYRTLYEEVISTIPQDASSMKLNGFDPEAICATSFDEVRQGGEFSEFFPAFQLFFSTEGVPHLLTEATNLSAIRTGSVLIGYRKIVDL